MDHRLDEILNRIDDAYGHKLGKGGRHYLEVSLGNQAKRLGYADLMEKYRNTFAIVPLKHPEPGMKVRIDGRTFVDYAQYASGIAVPGHVARQTTLAFTPFVALDSMICNFT
jgi:hypothetical protein